MDTITTGANTGFAGLRQDLADAAHAPGFIYWSPDVFRREIDEIFMKDWLYVGRVEEVEKPGDYMTLRIVGEPVVISRDRDGVLHANYNMCLHRGVEVAEGNGNTRAFKCPYHGWTYNLQGQLTGAAGMKESNNFDAAKCRLRPIRFDTWRGNMFICFDPDARPLDDFIAEFETDFGFLQMENCRLGFKLTIDLECNWKFAFENLMDFYHVPVLHAKSFGSRVKWDNRDVTLKENGGVTIRYVTSPSTPGGVPLLGKMPWLEHEDVSLGRAGFMHPNFALFARIDYAGPMIVWPVTENSCQVVIYRLFPVELFSRPDIEEKLKVYHDFQITVLEEDRTMIESMQRAMSSKNYVPGRMSAQEKSIRHYLNSYLDRVFGPDAGRP